MGLRLLLLLMVIVAPLMVMGQPRSQYNLNRVRVELMDGGTVRGKWISASNDTLVMEGTVHAGTKSLVPGSEVSFRLKGAGRDYEGTLVDVTKTTLVVKLTEQPDTTFVVNRTYVTYLEVTHRAYDQPARMVKVPVQQIRSIRVHGRGAGAFGFIAGAVVGWLISQAIYANNPIFSSDAVTYEGAIVPFLITPFIGVAITTSGRKHPIDGSTEKFKAFVQKAIRGGKSK